MPQQVQRSGSTVATSGSSSAEASLEQAAAWVTAARPEATLSDESWAPGRPADHDPVDHGLDGRSLGWISLKKPSLPTGSFSVLTRASFFRGTMPVTRTTRSTGMSNPFATGSADHAR